MVKVNIWYNNSITNSGTFDNETSADAWVSHHTEQNTLPSGFLVEKVPVDVNALKWTDLRTERNRRLTASDWTQLNDSPLKNDPNWLQYRQDLRDLPANTLDPDQVVYPNEPN